MEKISNNKWVNRYIYLKLCFDTATGNLHIPSAIFDWAFKISVVLKLWNITDYWLVGLVSVVGIILILYGGHLLYSKGFVAREQSIVNKYNPEIQEILKNSKK